jgi:hypothetical protein
MKRAASILTPVFISFLFLSLGGCGKPNTQRGTNTSPVGAKGAEASTNGHANGEVLALSAETKPVSGVTEGEPSDRGTLTLSDATHPVDGFRSMKANAQETLMLPDGGIYVGELREGKPSGQGTIINPNGTNQRGEWRVGKEYRVSGTWVALDGTKEEGTWNTDGSQSGGTIIWKDGREYFGDWKLIDGAPEMPDGMGAMAWPDGRKYIGQFQDGKIDGTGKMTYPDGKIQEGVWKDGKFVGASTSP